MACKYNLIMFSDDESKLSGLQVPLQPSMRSVVVIPPHSSLIPPSRKEAHSRGNQKVGATTDYFERPYSNSDQTTLFDPESVDLGVWRPRHDLTVSHSSTEYYGCRDPVGRASRYSRNLSPDAVQHQHYAARTRAVQDMPGCFVNRSPTRRHRSPSSDTERYVHSSNRSSSSSTEDYRETYVKPTARTTAHVRSMDGHSRERHHYPEERSIRLPSIDDNHHATHRQAKNKTRRPERHTNTPLWSQKRSSSESSGSSPHRSAHRKHRSTRRRRETEPRRYNGKEPIDEYMVQFELLSKRNGWAEKDKVSALLCALDGPARGMLLEWENPSSMDYADIKKALLKRFGTTEELDVHERALYQLQWNKGRSVQDLAQEIRKLARRAYPDIAAEGRERFCVKSFIRAIPDKKISYSIKEKGPKTLQQACDLYEHFDALQDDSDIERRPLPAKSNRHVAQTKEMEINESQPVRVTKPSDNNGSLPRKPCPVCKQTGHWKRDCPTLLSRQQTSSCFSCGQPGHRWRNCPNSGNGQRTNPGAANSVRRSSQQLKAQRTKTEGPIAAYLRISVNGRPRLCLLDSGADVCLVPASWINLAQLTPSERTITAANGTEIASLGEIRLSFTINNLSFHATFLVSPNIEDGILGLDWLSENNVQWNFGKKQISIDNRCFALSTGPNRNRCNRIIATGNVSIPPRTEMIIPAYVIRDVTTTGVTETSWITIPGEPVKGLHVARSLIDPQAARCTVRACNATDRAILLKTGQNISQLQQANQISPTLTGDDPQRQEEVKKLIEDLVSRMDSSVPTDISDQVKALLSEFNDVLSVSEFDLGRTGIVKHQIDTGNNRPIRQALRPQPRVHLPVIDQLVDDMQQQGIIEPCQSEWASNIVLVKKKDGSVRFCVDYRKLNDITRKDAYPLPRIDTCLDRLSGSVWYSTFDLRSGFHQVEVDPADVNKTTFICHRGTFRFPRMPFGLCNAPATFQRLMDLVMTGLTYETCLIYLDDLIVFSQDLQGHLHRLRSLFERLRNANLKLKPSKCQILQKEVKFLGFMISHQGIATDPDKVAAVRNWPVPQTLRQSRAFVGFCQYYRRFIPNFSKIASPLHSLTKKGVRFDWTTACQQAFEQLKEALTNTEVLALPTERDRYILDCDASDQAMGAVLSQIQNGTERPICYASQLFSKHERNYNVTRKELLAVITFVKKFRQYLLGQPFTIRTDHAALQWLKHTPEPIGQQARWLEILEEFDYEIVHRAGVSHSNADALSRSHTVNAITQQPCEPNVPYDWAKLQQDDEDIKFIYELVVNKSTTPDLETITGRSADVKTLSSQLSVLDIDEKGVLRRHWNQRHNVHSQIIVPYQLRREIADNLHRGLNGGHLGLRRSRLHLQQRFYWPGWSKDVQLAQQRCEQCAAFKKPPNTRQGRLQPMVVGEPWERIGIDVTGPHPVSSRGNVYILTMIDCFTKWVELFPMRNQEASTIAKILVDRVFCTHGVPLQILSDRGTNFESDLFQEICRLLSVDKVRTTAYKPSTNGNIERFHSTLNSMLAKLVNDNHRNWDELLPAVSFAYRSSVQEATGFSPYYLMYGREARIPADLLYDTNLSEKFDSTSDYATSLINKLHDAFCFVRQNLETAANRRKTQYDLRVRPMEYPIGTWVYHYVPRRRSGKNRKWQKYYEGPYLVVKNIGPVNVQLQRSARSGPFVTHIDKLKRCYREDLRSWLTNSVEPSPPNVPAFNDTTQSTQNVEIANKNERPRRTIRRPVRFRTDQSL